MIDTNSEFQQTENESNRQLTLSELYKLWQTDKDKVREITEKETKRIMDDRLAWDSDDVPRLARSMSNDLMWALDFKESVMVANYLFMNHEDKTFDNYPDNVVEKVLSSYRDECLEKSINENNRDGLRLVFEAIESRRKRLTASNSLESIYKTKDLRPNRDRSYIDDEPEIKALIDLDPEVKWIVKPLLLKSIRGVSMSESAEAWHVIKEYFGIEGVYEALSEIYSGDPKPWETVTISDQVDVVMTCGERKMISGKVRRWSSEDIRMKRECLELINSKVDRFGEYRQMEALAGAVSEHKAYLEDEELKMIPEAWLKLEPGKYKSRRNYFGDYYYTNEIKSFFSVDEREKVDNVIDKILENKDLATALRSMHVASHTNDAFVNEDLIEMLQCEEIMDLIELVWDIPSEQHLIAKWASFSPVEKWSEKLKDKLSDEVVGSDVELKFKKQGWELCNRAEDKMWQSINLGLTILVEGKLLLKGSGKMSALCLSSFTTKNGFHFVKGCWYSPDIESQTKYKEGLVTGEEKLSFDEGEEWILMRNLGFVRSSNEKNLLGNSEMFFELVRDYALSGLPSRDKKLRLEERRGYLMKAGEEMSD